MICFRPLIGNTSSLVALILLLLCLFAGSSRQFLPNATILRINISKLSIKDAPDFFNVYLMSYCFGFEKECVVDDASNTTTIQSTITSCSDLNPLFLFDPGQAILEAIAGTDSRLENGWPSYLSDDFIALTPTTQAMTILFILGTCAVGLSVVLRLSTVRYIWQPQGSLSPVDGIEPPSSYPGYPRPRSFSDIPPSKLQLVSLISSTLLLIIASVIATVISMQFVSLLSKSGSPRILAASNGNFLGIAWTAVAIQALLTSDALVALLRYRARHCHCDWEELPTAPGPENKRRFPGYD